MLNNLSPENLKKINSLRPFIRNSDVGCIALAVN